MGGGVEETSLLASKEVSLKANACKVQTLVTILTYQNYIYEQIKSRLNMKNASLLISCLLFCMGMKLELSDKLRIYVQHVQEQSADKDIWI